MSLNCRKIDVCSVDALAGDPEEYNDAVKMTER